MSGEIAQFVTLAQTTRGAGVVHVIRQALAHPNTFVFGELLSVPGVSQLAENPDHKKWLDVLRLFAYGTYLDYKETKDKNGLPQLEEKELTKLKELTVLSLASNSRVLSYDELQTKLDLADVRQLEDLLIATITHGLINAKLDQATRQVEVLNTTGRDLKEDALDTMLEMLKKWQANAQTVVDALLSVEEMAKKNGEERAKDKTEQAEKIAALKTAIKKDLQEGNSKHPGMMHGLGMGDSMADYMGMMDDDDEMMSRPKMSMGGRSNKRRGFDMMSGLGFRRSGV